MKNKETYPQYVEASGRITQGTLNIYIKTIDKDSYVYIEHFVKYKNVDIPDIESFAISECKGNYQTETKGYGALFKSTKEKFDKVKNNCINFLNKY